MPQASGYASIYGTQANDRTVGDTQSLAAIKTPQISYLEHAGNHGNTFIPNAAWYLKTSDHLALDGNRVVDARFAAGCRDSFAGFGCKKTTRTGPLL